MVLAAVLPLAAGGLYFWQGAPLLSGQSASGSAAVSPAPPSRVPDSRPAGRDAEMATLVARLAERMKDRPDDARGWRLLGRSLASLGRHSEAARAYGRAVALLPADADLRSLHGEALASAGGGTITAEAERAFAAALRIDPREPRARFYLGLSALQKGDREGALARWRELEAASPDDAEWLPMLRRRIASLAPGGAVGTDAEAPPRGPTREDIAAAQQMLPEERAEMIRGMVARLALRLEEEPDDAEGWARLARSYRVLGEAEKERDALAQLARLRPDDVGVLSAYARGLLRTAKGGPPPRLRRDHRPHSGPRPRQPRRAAGRRGGGLPGGRQGGGASPLVASAPAPARRLAGARRDRLAHRRARRGKLTRPAETRRVSVVVAGGGPVGMVAAIELGRRGIRCALLNDGPTTATHPKANAISSRTMEHLRRLGLAEAVRARGLDDDHPTDLAYFTRLTGHEIGRYEQPSRRRALAEAAAGTGRWASPEPPHRCSQLFLEAELKKAVDARPSVEVRFGWRMEEFHDRGDGVTALARRGDGSAEIVYEASYLIGCDGAGSDVRAALGVELMGESGAIRPMMGGPMYATYFEADPHPGWLAQRPAWQYWILNPEIRALFIPVDGKNKFLFIAALGAGDGGMRDPTAMIHRAAGAKFPLRVISALNWTAGYALVAERYRRGRVFLAGDAAHLFTPTGGMGMNTGIDDAVNLAWKLAATIAGWGGRRLIDSYQAERRPIAERNTAFASRFADSIGRMPVGAAVEEDSAAGRAARAALKPLVEDHAHFEFTIPGIFLGLSYAGSPIVAGDGTAPAPDDPNEYTPNARPGARAPHARLADGALHDALGPEFTLLRFGGASDPAPLFAAARSRGLPLASTAVDDAAARTIYGADLVLIRPDHHVAWRGDRLPRDCGSLLDRVRGWE